MNAALDHARAKQMRDQHNTLMGVLVAACLSSPNCILRVPDEAMAIDASGYVIVEVIGAAGFRQYKALKTISESEKQANE